ncbi:MAG: hypothetical protein ACI9DO_000569 [Reinekea sp.]|jgi:hypothetical protein
MAKHSAHGCVYSDLSQPIQLIASQSIAHTDVFTAALQSEITTSRAETTQTTKNPASKQLKTRMTTGFALCIMADLLNFKRSGERT